MPYTLCYSRTNSIWMYLDPMSTKFVEGTDSFVKATIGVHSKQYMGDGYIHCPRVDWKNQKQFRNIKQIRCHRLHTGFTKKTKMFGIRMGNMVRTYLRKSQRYTIHAPMRDTIGETVCQTINETENEIGQKL